MSSEEPQRPLLRVVRGEPDDAELAALIAVVSARAAATADAPEPEPNAWT
ncbi:acyl-CoA carboxylase subunit epsilon, partial [Sporichthya sp.]